jgi:ABC-2 type transport system ATP-binding protein
VQTRGALLETVRNLASDGAAVCYSTHYLEEVEALGASVALLDAGELIARGGVADLIARHSCSVLELRFDGCPPDTDLGRGWEVRGDVLRVYAEQPAAEVPAVLARLGAARSRLRSLEIVGTSLEGVFLALTGRRFGPAGRRDDAGAEGLELAGTDALSLHRTPEGLTLTG